MRNLKTKILVAGTTFTLAFAFGIAVWKRQPLSLCTATEYRLRYQLLKGDNYVNLNGYLYGGKDLGFGDAKLNGCEGSTAEVVLADESKLSRESQELIRELRRKTDISEVRGSDREDKFARAEVQLIGTLSEREQYCFTSRYVITTVEITPTGSLEVIDASTFAKEIKEPR
jgi:hypothetical protein